jgi:lysophospholipase-2
MASDPRLHVKLPSSAHTHTIILLHGRDSTAAEFASEFFESQASDNLTVPEIFPSFKWVFPSSGLRASARFETEMSQWFDIWSVEEPEKRKGLQKDGLRKSVAFILEVVRKEMESVPAKRIILGGISQGCATAVHALFALGVAIGGFIGFCGWLPLQGEMDDVANCIEKREGTATSALLEDIWNLPQSLANDSERRTGRNVVAQLRPIYQTPVLLSHSKDDEVVPIANGERLGSCLQYIFKDVVSKTYEDGGHWVNEPWGIDDIV